MSKFAGAVYDPAQDDARLSKQIGRVWSVMQDEAWRTLAEIKEATTRISGAPVGGDPEASISAQLRHLTREQHGKHRLNKRPRGDRRGGLYEYQLLPRAAAQPGQTEPVRTAFQEGQGLMLDMLPAPQRA